MCVAKRMVLQKLAEREKVFTPLAGVESREVGNPIAWSLSENWMSSKKLK
jgi:hypothetical protein